MIRKQEILKRILKWVLCLGILVILTGCEKPDNLQTDADSWAPKARNCWSCMIYGTMFEIINTIGLDATESAIEAAKMILGLGLLFLLAWRVGQMTLLMSEKNMAGIMKEMMVVLSKAMAVGIILWNKDYFLEFIRELIIEPIGEFFLAMSNAVLDCVSGTDEYFRPLDGAKDLQSVLPASDSGAPKVSNFVFGDIGEKVQDIVGRTFTTLVQGMGLAMNMFAGGSMYSWAIGVVAMWQVLMLMMTVPVMFADGFIQIGFTIVMLPILLALWVFPGQDKYIKGVIPSDFITPFLNILFGCIYLVLMMTTLQVLQGEALGNILNPSAETEDTSVIDNAMAGTPPIWIVLILLIAIRKFADYIGQYTALFGGGSDSGIIIGMVKGAIEKAKKVAVVTVKVAARAAAGDYAGAAKDAAVAVAQEGAQAAGAVAGAVGGGGQGGGSAGGGG